MPLLLVSYIHLHTVVCMLQSLPVPHYVPASAAASFLQHKTKHHFLLRGE